MQIKQIVNRVMRAAQTAMVQIMQIVFPSRNLELQLKNNFLFLTIFQIFSIKYKFFNKRNKKIFSIIYKILKNLGLEMSMISIP